MAQMTQAQIAAFLAPPRHAIVATNRADGPPQLTPVWYIYEGGQMYISAGAGAVKVQNLRRDPRVTICVDGGHPDARYVILQGTITILEPSDPLQEQMRWRIIRHYYEDEDEARRYYESMRDSPSVLLVLAPDKLISQDFN
ncbi:MAG: PPOX class F420-dependent oxidoreductase [Caldilineaceae bacterium]